MEPFTGCACRTTMPLCAAKVSRDVHVGGQRTPPRATSMFNTGPQTSRALVLDEVGIMTDSTPQSVNFVHTLVRL